MTKRLLTNRERILYLLSRYEYDEEKDYVADRHLSQDGISDRLDMRKNNVSRELSELREEDLVEEKKARVKGFDRRRKIYVLTEKGREAKEELEEELKKKEIKIQTKGEGNTLTNVEGAVKRSNDRSSGHHIDPFHVAEWMRKKDVLDLDEFTRSFQPLGGEKTEILKQAPTSKDIYGRSEEIETLIKKLENEDPPIIVIEGMAGIGKTALGRSLLDEIQGKRDILWYSFHPWEDESSFVEVLNDFCQKCCGKKLDRDGSLPKISRTFLDSIGTSRPVFFFDDCEKIPSRIKTFFEILLREKRGGKNFSAVLMTRESLDFHEVRDELRGDLFNMRLESIGKEGIKQMLDVDESRAEEAIQKTKGHPLYLELYERYPEASSQMREFLEKEIYSKIDEEKRHILQRLSVFWSPVKKDLVAKKDGIDHIIELKKNNMLWETDEGKIDLHSILKEFFYEHTSLERKKELHAFAAERLREIEDKDRDLEFLYHLEKAGKGHYAIEKMDELTSKISQLDRSLREDIIEAFPESELPEEEKGRYFRLRGDIYSRCEEWKKASKFYEKAKKIKEEDREVEEKLADIQMRLEEWEDTIETHEKALSKYKEERDIEGQFREYLSLGMVYRKKGEYEQAKTYYDEAKHLLDELEDKEEAEVTLHNNIGMLYLSRNQYKKAEGSFRKALDIGGNDAILHENLSIVFEEIGDLDRAIEHIDKAIRSEEKQGNYREVIDLLLRISNHLVKKGELEQALDRLKRALRYERKRTGSFWIFGRRKGFSAKKIRIHEKLAEVYKEKGERDDCLRHRKKAVEMYKKKDEDVKAAREKLKYAFDLRDHGRLKESLNVLTDLEEELERLNLKEGITAARLERTRIYREKGEYRKGEKILNEVIEDAESRGDTEAVEAGKRILQEIHKAMGKTKD